MDVNIFKIKDGKIALNKYRLTIRYYDTLQKQNYTDDVMYVDEDRAYEWEVNRVPKHALWEVVSKTELDTSEYAWMEGIELRTTDTANEIEKIASYGSLEAYTASLPETAEQYMLDLDYRLSKSELGL